MSESDDFGFDDIDDEAALQCFEESQKLMDSLPPAPTPIPVNTTNRNTTTTNHNNQSRRDDRPAPPPAKKQKQTTLFSFKTPAIDRPIPLLTNPSASSAPSAKLDFKTLNIDTTSAREEPYEEVHEMDEEALQKYVYPTNYAVRDYQFNILRSALVSNTLVCLPTGLGKTLIAAVVMYNYYRWFPEGKIVFMAPTKPLVNQQIDACFKITGIPKEVTCELTGSIPVDLRTKYWNTKRIFFMTPETFRNDIQTRCCPVENVVLVVFDEAHRASGNYAYCDVVKEMVASDCVFRILALSATPGSDVKKVQAVINNLCIQKLELRTEESFDVQPYIFSRKVEEVVVPQCPIIAEYVRMFSPIVGAILKRLHSNKAVFKDDPASVSSFALLKGREAWRRNKRGLPQGLQIMIESDFAIAMSLMGYLNRLKTMGITAFYNAIKTYISETRQNPKASKTKMGIANNPVLAKILQSAEDKMNRDDYCSHPKVAKLVDIVVKHFTDHKQSLKQALEDGDIGADAETRVMIFSTFRESVEELCQALKKHGPLLRPTLFVGQSSAKSKGMKQKEQLQQGKFNVICATSIGEEGLDIGEVDLIICFDSQKSPIRMLQRCGRTGRKRKGKICLLINQGAEEADVKKSRSQYKSVQKSIVEGKNLVLYYGPSSRILPPSLSLTCERQLLEIPTASESSTDTKGKKTRSSKTASAGPYLNKNQQKEYEETFLPSGFIKRNKPLSLTRHLHWQTHQLPLKTVPRSSRSTSFVNLMAYFQTLAQDETDINLSDSERDPDVSLFRDTSKEYDPFEGDPDFGKLSKELDSLVPASRSLSPGLSHLDTRRNNRPVSPFEGPGFDADGPEGNVSCIMIEDTIRSDGFQKDVSCVMLEDTILSDDIAHDLDHKEDDFLPETVTTKIRRTVTSIDQNFQTDANTEEGDRGETVDVDSLSDVLGIISDDDFDFDWDSIVHPGIPLPEVDNGKPIQLTELPKPEKNEQEDGSIADVLVDETVYFETEDDLQGIDWKLKRTPLLERLSERNLPRRAPKMRGTPMMVPSKRKEGPGKREKGTKNQKAEAYFDFEAVLSDEGSSVSSDETSEEDRDLSGFIISSDLNISANVSPVNMQDIYRNSLMSPSFGGFVKPDSSRNLLGKLRGISAKGTVVPSVYKKPEYSESDSLASFVCDDDIVEFESQKLDSFLDYTQNPGSLIMQKSVPAPSHLEASKVNVDDLGLDDLIDISDY